MQRQRVGFIGQEGDLPNRIKHAVESAGHSFAFCFAYISNSLWQDFLKSVDVVFVEILSEKDLVLYEAISLGRVADQRLIAITHDLQADIVRGLIRMGLSDWLTVNAEDELIIQACESIKSGTVKQGKCNVMAFTPVLGGMGATTLAIETALLIGRQTKEDVCVVDLDFYAGECADYLNLEPKLAIDILSADGSALDDHLINAILSEHVCGLHLLAAQTRLGESYVVNPKSVIGILNLLAARYMNVIIDLPRAWYNWTDEVVCGCDHLFLVSDSSVPSLRAAKRQLKEYEERYNSEISPFVIVNKKQKGWFSDDLSEADLKASLGSAYAGSVAIDARVARQAIDAGLPVSSVKMNSDIIRDLGKIIEKFR